MFMPKLFANIHHITHSAPPKYFPRKTVKLSKNTLIFVIFMTIDRVVTIYGKSLFDTHKRRRPSMVNAHLPLLSIPLHHFQNAKWGKLLMSGCHNTKNIFCIELQMNISDRTKVMVV